VRLDQIALSKLRGFAESVGCFQREPEDALSAMRSSVGLRHPSERVDQPAMASRHEQDVDPPAGWMYPMEIGTLQVPPIAQVLLD